MNVPKGYQEVIESLSDDLIQTRETLTRAQAEGTRLVTENRELKAKLEQLQNPAALLEQIVALRGLISRVMTFHWDIQACPCPFCKIGRELGCAPSSVYLNDEEFRKHFAGDLTRIGFSKI